MSLLSDIKIGRLFIVSAPTGTGKTTLVERLTREFPLVVQSISYTTRERRPGEISGRHYHYITRSEFERRIGQGEFLEYIELYGDYYGTSRLWVQERLQMGQHVVLVIDTQGAQQVMQQMAHCAIFIQPPSLEVLRARLVQRGTDSMEAIAARLSWAYVELSMVDRYDYTFVNEDLEIAYQILRSIVIAESYRLAY